MHSKVDRLAGVGRFGVAVPVLGRELVIHVEAQNAVIVGLRRMKDQALRLRLPGQSENHPFACVCGAAQELGATAPPIGRQSVTDELVAADHTQCNLLDVLQFQDISRVRHFGGAGLPCRLGDVFGLGHRRGCGIGQGRPVMCRPRCAIPVRDQRVLQERIGRIDHVEGFHVELELPREWCGVQAARAGADIIPVRIRLLARWPVAGLTPHPNICQKRGAEFVLARWHLAAGPPVIILRSGSEMGGEPALEVIVHKNLLVTLSPPGPERIENNQRVAHMNPASLHLDEVHVPDRARGFRRSRPPGRMKEQRIGCPFPGRHGSFHVHGYWRGGEIVEAEAPAALVGHDPAADHGPVGPHFAFPRTVGINPVDVAEEIAQGTPDGRFAVEDHLQNGGAQSLRKVLGS